MNNQIIVTHECGHLTALMATGLYDEFTRIAAVPTVCDEGPVNGVTLRSGDSLRQLQGELLAWSSKLTAQPAAVADFVNFLAGKGAEACLPHICFFYGGGAIDHCRGSEDETRNSIDKFQITVKVLPSLTITDPDGCSWMKERIYAFLESVFQREQALISRIEAQLNEHPEMDKAQMDAFLSDDPNGGAEGVKARAREEFQALLKEFRGWYVKYLNGKFATDCSVEG